MPYTARELPLEEWDRLTGLPIASGASPLNPENAAVCVVERDGQIVATWGALTMVHAEGCWIDPAHRRNPAVVQALIAGFFTMLHAHGLAEVLTVTQTEEVGALAAGLGGTKVGQLWMLRVPAPVEA